LKTTTRQTATHAALAVLALMAGGCAGVAPEDADSIQARRVETAPVLDGLADDAAWRESTPLEVELTGGTGPSHCAVRAVAHGDSVYVLATWADATEDRAHKVWTKQEDGSWRSGPEREDVFSMAFPLSGPFEPDMLAPLECRWDVWHWKAARTDPAGYAMDKSHSTSLTDPGGKRAAIDLDGGQTIYIARPEDAGGSATKSLPHPTSGTSGPKYEAATPTGSASDVRAKATWKDGVWTLELSRRLSTGHGDDAQFPAGGSIEFAIGIFDRAEHEDHSTSRTLTLQLP
jgi:hypothetical protein